MHHLGYAGAFLALFLEAIGVPFPAETILVTSGVEMIRGVFHFWPLLLSAVFGNILGSNIAYGIGRYVGRRALLKYGRYIKITEAHLQSVEKKFHKYQMLFLVVGKFIAFVRILVPYLAGINKVIFWKFTIYNTASAFGWAALFILLGRTIESVWKHDSHLFISHWYISIPALLVLVIGAWWTHRRLDRLGE